MTTREPDAAIAEVAITAFNAMIEQEALISAREISVKATSPQYE
jgi:uncharacterized protein YqhQ